MAIDRRPPLSGGRVSFFAPRKNGGYGGLLQRSTWFLCSLNVIFVPEVLRTHDCVVRLYDEDSVHLVPTCRVYPLCSHLLLVCSHLAGFSKLGDIAASKAMKKETVSLAPVAGAKEHTAMVAFRHLVLSFCLLRCTFSFTINREEKRPGEDSSMHETRRIVGPRSPAQPVMTAWWYAVMPRQLRRYFIWQITYAARGEQVSALFFVAWTQRCLAECFPWATEGPNPPKETLTFKKEFFGKQLRDHYQRALKYVRGRLFGLSASVGKLAGGGSGQLWRHTQPQTGTHAHTHTHTHQSCPCFKMLYM